RIWIAALLLAPSSMPAAAAELALVFSVKTWEGEYASADIPGGVKSTPTLGAIYTINSDGGGLRQIVPAGQSTDYPAASPDGRWIYFQSKIAGDNQIFRCGWDGAGATSLTPPDQLTKQLRQQAEFAVKDSYGYVLSADGRKMVFTVHDGKSG